MNVFKFWTLSFGFAASGAHRGRMIMAQRRGFAGKDQVVAETPAEDAAQWMNKKLRPRDSILEETQVKQHFPNMESGKQFDPSENLRVSKHYDDIPFVQENVEPQPRNPSTFSNSENRLGTDESFVGFWGDDQKKMKMPKVKVARAIKVPEGKVPDQSESGSR